MLYILDQQKNYSFPIADNYVVYMRSIKSGDLEMHIIAVDTAPEKGPGTKNAYSLGTYHDETAAHNIMRVINKLRSTGDAHYVMPEENEEEWRQKFTELVSKMEVEE